jgi:methyl-accepting chemotaxis protein
VNIRDRVGHQFRDLQGADLDLLAYITAIIIGALFVAISKALDAPTILLTLIPIFIIGGYIVACFLIPKLELRRDQLGDNVYYLGFILTLVSLTTTLIRFSENPSDSEIVSNFGLALVATIVGIVGRTVLNQMRKDPLAIEKESRLELAKASSQLRAQVMSSVEDFASLHRQMKQVQEEAMKDVKDAYRSMGQGLSQAVVESVQEFSGGVAQLNSSLDAHNLAMNRSIDKLSDVSERLSELDLDPSKIVTLSDALSTFADGVQERVQEVAEQLVETNSRVSSVAASFDQSLASLNKSIDSFGNRLDMLGDSAEDIGPRIAEMEEVTGVLANIQRESISTSEALQNFNTSLTNMSNGLNLYSQSDVKLDDVSVQLNHLVKVSSDLIEKIAQNLANAESILATIRQRDEDSKFSISRLFSSSDKSKD